MTRDKYISVLDGLEDISKESNSWKVQLLYSKENTSCQQTKIVIDYFLFRIPAQSKQCINQPTTSFNNKNCQSIGTYPVERLSSCIAETPSICLFSSRTNRQYNSPSYPEKNLRNNAFKHRNLTIFRTIRHQISSQTSKKKEKIIANQPVLGTSIIPCTLTIFDIVSLLQKISKIPRQMSSVAVNKSLRSSASSASSKAGATGTVATELLSADSVTSLYKPYKNGQKISSPSH